LVAQHASNAPKGEDAFYRSALASALEIEPGSARPDEGLAAAAAALRQSAAHVAMAQPTDEAHVKARRFAKLLVDEIKLYYEPRVAEGRAHYDLYQRLREEIDKSRAAYVKRYGETVRDVDYFSQELVRILADNNRAMMGPGFQG
jgi:predicted nucleotidyltransferase component of viral defense system